MKSFRLTLAVLALTTTVTAGCGSNHNQTAAKPLTAEQIAAVRAEDQAVADEEGKSIKKDKR